MPSAPSADAGDAQQLGVGRSSTRTTSPVPGDELHPDDGRRQVAEPEPGAVGGGGDGAGDRLAVDVAEVGHRQADRGELVVEAVQADAGLTRHPPASRSTCEHPVACRSSDELHAVGRGGGRERVPGADRLDPLPGLGGAAARSAATSSVDRGAARSAATQRWLPAQLDSVDGIAGIVRARRSRSVRRSDA